MAQTTKQAMNEQVLVIEDWIEFLTVYGLSKKDGDCLIRDYGSPGPLLAEFEAWTLEDDVQKFKKAEAPSLILFNESSASKAPRDTIKQPVHVLISARTDEGGEVKK